MWEPDREQARRHPHEQTVRGEEREEANTPATSRLPNDAELGGHERRAVRAHNDTMRRSCPTSWSDIMLPLGLDSVLVVPSWILCPPEPPDKPDRKRHNNQKG